MARMLAIFSLAPALLYSQGAEVPESGMAASVADDEVCEAGDCGLELRQLRAREKQASVQEHGALSDAAFGNDAVGTGMWKETTWGDILLEIEATMNWSGSCETNSYGTCSVFGCAETRGATVCKGGNCMCADGYCAKGGACYPKTAQCLEDTGGTCSIGSCKSSRGTTKCKGGKCLCKTGGCAWKGKCFPVTDTGGSCSLVGCKSSRGPTTCHRGRCLCKDGYVAVNGRCESFALIQASETDDVQVANGDVDSKFGPDVEGTGMWKETTWGDILLEIEATMNWSGSCETNSYGTCSVFGCAETRGATVCKGGNCMCADGYCAKGGACYPKTAQCLEDTGGTCSIGSCKSSRGTTKCKGGKCLCKTGGCAWKGKCFPVTDTGGSCSLVGCKSSRGPTTCHRGRCLCKDGYVAVNGRCEKFL